MWWRQRIEDELRHEHILYITEFLHEQESQNRNLMYIIKRHIKGTLNTSS